MVVLLLIERYNLRKVAVGQRTYMVMHNVDHDPDVHGVGFLYQPYKSFFSAKSGLDLFKVLGEVSMVACRIGNVLDDRRNPDGIESHLLDVVEVVGYAVEVAATP